jgi:hypothetical protein
MNNNKIKYLENDICEFEPLTPINYSTKKNIISTSLFRMKEGGYKNFSIYLNGIKILSDISKKENLEVRIFIDETIYNDQRTMEFLKKYDNITLILYKCPNFLINKHHVGLFGTLVRFFPLFNFPNNDAKVVFLADADTKEYRVMYLIKLYNFLKKNKVSKKVYLAYSGRYFHSNISSNKITNLSENDKEELYLPYCIAQKFFGTKRITKKPFLKFLKKIQLYMDDNTRPKKILSDYIITPDKFKIKCENNICYGIDEYFINKILFKYMLRKNIPFCYSVSFNLAQFYYFNHPKNMKEDLIKIPKDEHIKVFNEYMKEFGLDEYSYDEIDKNVYVDDDEADNESTATPFMSSFAKKIIPLLEKIDKNKDYRIFTKSQIYSMKQVDYKKYFRIRFVRFLNTDIKDIIDRASEYENRL